MWCLMFGSEAAVPPTGSRTCLCCLSQVNRFSKSTDRALLVTDKYVYKLDPKKHFKVLKRLPVDSVSPVKGLDFHYCVFIIIFELIWLKDESFPTMHHFNRAASSSRTNRLKLSHGDRCPVYQMFCCVLFKGDGLSQSWSFSGHPAHYCPGWINLTSRGL